MQGLTCQPAGPTQQPPGLWSHWRQQELPLTPAGRQLLQGRV